MLVAREMREENGSSALTVISMLSPGNGDEFPCPLLLLCSNSFDLGHLYDSLNLSLINKEFKHPKFTFVFC